MSKDEGTFTAKEDEGTHWGQRTFFYRKNEFSGYPFYSVIAADTRLREIVQRKEALHKKLKEAEKGPKIRADCMNSCRWEGELKSLCIEQRYQERWLSDAEDTIPRFIRLIYYSIRKNPRWYLQKELVEDCAVRGGCCGRACGCCEERASPALQGRKGIGHCTVQCACCSDVHKLDIIAGKKQKIAQDLDDAFKSRNPDYLLRITQAYFSPRPEAPVKKEKKEAPKGRTERLKSAFVNLKA